VPWAALVDINGYYLLQRHLVSIAPSLRVSSNAFKRLQPHVSTCPGHALVVGNLSPNLIGSLPQAEKEAKIVADILSSAKMEVRSLNKQVATKDQPRFEDCERVCCLLVLNSVTSTPQWIRQPEAAWGHSSSPSAPSFSRSPSPPPPYFTQSPSLPRLLVRDGQTRPQRPRLVVSCSTCPPLSVKTTTPGPWVVRGFILLVPFHQ